MAKERKCLTCQKVYNYCPNCGQYSSYPTWMVEFDTESCKELFNAISGYNMGIIDANGVKDVVRKYNITDFSIYKKSIADKLKEICGKEDVNKVSEPIIPSETPKESAIPTEPDKGVTPKPADSLGFMKKDRFKKNDNKGKANE